MLGNFGLAILAVTMLVKVVFFTLAKNPTPRWRR
jgi:membrane protein insertase Oxa1/YidC/SpoIIIJ